MKITEYTKEQIQQLVKDGVCPVQALRDYEVLCQIQNGEKIANVAMDNNLCRAQVYNIKKKYTPKL